jgi:arsenite-transporting ATPase
VPAAADRPGFPCLPLRIVPAARAEPVGPAALKTIGRALARRSRPPRARRMPPRAANLAPATAAGDSPSWLDRIAPRGTRLVAVCGKGGVGKTTCAATIALALAARAPRSRVLVLSVDPAHSLGDVLGARLDDREREVTSAPRNLRARELDAAGAFAAERARYRDRVAALFDRLTGGGAIDTAFDRAVVQDLVDLSPSGLDELVALASLGRALPRYRTVVLDTAPTGHALRLLALPETALAWVHALMAILLKYRRVIGLGDAAAELLDLAQKLRRLDALLRDRRAARFVVVTRAAALPRLETLRLRSGLRRLGMPPVATVVSALATAGCAACGPRARAEAAELKRLAGRAERDVMLGAPACYPPPRGPGALQQLGRTWTPIHTKAAGVIPARRPTTLSR